MPPPTMTTCSLTGSSELAHSTPQHSYGRIRAWVRLPQGVCRFFPADCGSALGYPVGSPQTVRGSSPAKESMRRSFTAALVVLATLSATAPARAQGADFYRSLLRRGIADHGAGKNEQALRELRISAFGLIDSIPEYETAQIYIALLHDRLKQEPEARLAIQRIFAAERVAPQLTTLPLDPAARSAFDALARKLLTSVDYARLHGTATAPTVPPEVSGDQQAIAGSDGTQPAPAPPSTPVPAPQPSKPPKVETY